MLLGINLLTYTTYKARNSGRCVIRVDTSNVSNVCSNCGMFVDKDLLERMHNCPFCSLSTNRDLNFLFIYSDWDYNLFVK